jgi:STE24 endopeptidase
VAAAAPDAPRLEHRDAPPAAFLGIIPLEEHRKAAAYTLAKARLGLLHLALEAGLLLFFTLGGGLQWLHDLLSTRLDSPCWPAPPSCWAWASSARSPNCPCPPYGQFRVEARFGFNRQTPAGFVADLAKQALLGLLLGGPLLLLVLWLMGVMGENWWLWVWGVWMGFNLLILAIYPTFIAPLFNKFTPLADEALRNASRNSWPGPASGPAASSSWTAPSAPATATPTSPAWERTSASSSTTPCCPN